MKLTCILLFFLMATAPAQAQTWDEWFKQKKTQKEYLLEQIAKLQIYITVLKKGYEIVDKGLTLIGNIKDEDFSLHDLFFSDLTRVKTIIRDRAEVQECHFLQRQIRKTAFSLHDGMAANRYFSVQERQFIDRQLEGLLHALAEDLHQLEMILTDGEVEWSDKERIQKILVVYAALQEKMRYVTSLSKRIYLLGEQRNKADTELQQLPQRLNRQP